MIIDVYVCWNAVPLCAFCLRPSALVVINRQILVKCDVRVCCQSNDKGPTINKTQLTFYSDYDSFWSLQIILRCICVHTLKPRPFLSEFCLPAPLLCGCPLRMTPYILVKCDVWICWQSQSSLPAVLSLPAALRRPEMTLHTFNRQLKAYLFHIWCTGKQKEQSPPPGAVVAFSWFWRRI